MPHPDPKVQGFIEVNGAALRQKIDSENKRRNNRGHLPLSQSEIDSFVRDCIADNGKIAGKNFPMSKAPIEPPEPPKPTGLPSSTIVHKRKGMIPGVEIPIVVNNENRFVFTVDKCANGFVAYVANAGKSEPYIFKTERDLLKVLKKALFGGNGSPPADKPKDEPTKEKITAAEQQPEEHHEHTGDVTGNSQRREDQQETSGAGGGHDRPPVGRSVGKDKGSQKRRPSEGARDK